jgi:hypothetical protein
MCIAKFELSSSGGEIAIAFAVNSAKMLRPMTALVILGEESSARSVIWVLRFFSVIEKTEKR